MKKLIFIFLLCLSDISFAKELRREGLGHCSSTGGFGNNNISYDVIVTPRVDLDGNIYVDSDIDCLNSNTGERMTVYIMDDANSGLVPKLDSLYTARLINSPGVAIPPHGDKHIIGVLLNDTFGFQKKLDMRFQMLPRQTSSGISSTQVVLNPGDIIAKINIGYGYNHADGDIYRNPAPIIIKTNTALVRPIASCDVNNKNLKVDMGNYVPGNQKTVPIDLSIKCGVWKNVSYKLSGKYEAGYDSIFSNISNNSPAEGVGIEIYSQGELVKNGQKVELYKKAGPSDYTNLYLTAKYKRTSLPLKPGNFETIIGVNFTHN